MRHSLAALALVTIATAFSAPSAHAFGDTCRRPIEATGSVQSTMQAARASAMAAWERSVRRLEGGRFADWSYSGDREFECSWTGIGVRITCKARATPCAPGA